MQAGLSQAQPLWMAVTIENSRRRAEFEDAVRTILREHGRPMHKTELFEAYRVRFPEGTVNRESFRRRLARVRESVRYDTETGGYWFFQEPPVFRSLPAITYPLRHYGTLADQCGCPLCVDWRAWRDAADNAADPVLDHERACTCHGCQTKHKARFAFLAAENRRNLWCEVSYHIAHTPEMTASGAVLMSRLKKILDDPGYSPNWWAIVGGQYPMGYWFRKLTTFATTASGAVSGAMRGERTVHAPS